MELCVCSEVWCELIQKRDDRRGLCRKASQDLFRSFDCLRGFVSPAVCRGGRAWAPGEKEFNGQQWSDLPPKLQTFAIHSGDSHANDFSILIAPKSCTARSTVDHDELVFLDLAE